MGNNLKICFNNVNSLFFILLTTGLLCGDFMSDAVFYAVKIIASYYKI